MKQILDVRDIVPLKTGVIIKELERETETESGLELTEAQHSGTPVAGQVVAVGEESKFKVGDIVFFRRYSVDTLSFPIDGKKVEVNFLTDSEIVAMMKNHEN